MAISGIDVSYYQGNIDWVSLKNSGVQFAILRLGYTGYASSKTKALDPMFEVYYRNAKAVGIPVGVYYFSRATTKEEGISEANFVLQHLQGKQLEYPVYIDVEDTYYQANTNIANLTSAVKAFCDTIESKKYYVGIYASLNWFNTKLNLNELTLYDKWVAQWGNVNTFRGPYGMWQYSSTGSIANVNPVDLNYAYKDFPKIMKEYGLNGYIKEIPPIPPKEDEDKEEVKQPPIEEPKEPIEEPKKPTPEIPGEDKNNSDKEVNDENKKQGIYEIIISLVQKLFRGLWIIIKKLFKFK